MESRKLRFLVPLLAAMLRKKSDVDLLIEFRGKKKDLLDHIILVQELEEALHRKVDVLTYNYIHPALRERILSEQVRIL